MHSKDPFANKMPAPVVVGTGLVALDVVIPGKPGAVPRLWVGGTCGNVVTILAYLGWRAYPVARIGEDSPALWVAQDFATWEVQSSLLLRERGGATPIIVQRIHSQDADRATHSFSWQCPVCGSDLPRYRPVRLNDLDHLTPHLPPADVFFFDRVSPAAIRLARHYAARGALVVLEPSSVGDQRLFHEAMSLVHVLKFSHERLGASAESFAEEQPLLIIETLGHEGLRYRGRLPILQGHEWQHLAALTAPAVRDTAGSGDWCTAGILHILRRGGLSTFTSIDGSLLVEALRFGQTLAAWNCEFEGARGGMYSVSKDVFRESVRAILAGSRPRTSRAGRRRANDAIARQFTCPSCPQ
jgi:fructokinase